MNVKRLGIAIDHFRIDHDLVNTAETRQLEHGVEQDVFENGPQSACTGLALDRAFGNRRPRVVGKGQVSILKLSSLSLSTSYE